MADFFVVVVLGDLLKDEFAVCMTVNEGQECSQGLWGIVLHTQKSVLIHSSLLVVLWRDSDLYKKNPKHFGAVFDLEFS